MSKRVSLKDRTTRPEKGSGLSTEKKPVPSSAVPSAYDVPFLQATIGNRALYRLFKAGVLQPKLEVGRPHDPYEQEADRVAEQVMNSGGKGQQSGVESRELIVRGPGSGVQSQKFGDSGAIQMKASCLSAGNSSCEEEKEEAVRTEKKREAIPLLSRDQESWLGHESGCGGPLPMHLRVFFEPRFGYDFSQVHIHADNQAAGIAHAINARAFTHGRDIYFGSGRYQPHTNEGQRLLAHELTHVAQAAQGVTEIRRAPGPEPTASEGSSTDLTAWPTEDLIREYLSLPAASSKYCANLSALLKERLRSITSEVELQGYRNLILTEGRSDQPRGIELYAFINRLLSVIEKREAKISEVGEEVVEMRSRLAKEEKKGVSTSEQEKLRRRLAWRENLLSAERPTRRWVLLHRGLIEELRIQYKDTPPSSELEVIANHVHEQQALLAGALKQDMGAIQKRMQDILDLLGGFGALVSEPEESYGMSLSESSPEYGETREALKQEYARLDDELKDEKKELDLLTRSFTEARWEAIRATYARFPVHPPPMWCMRALYKGIGAMFSPEASRELEVGIWKESVEYGKKEGKEAGDYRTVDRMMMNLGREGKTGAPVTTYYDRGAKRYVPNLRDLVAGMVSTDQPGRYMFGVSLHGGYHSVALAVEVTISGSINIYWLDQYSRAGFAQKTDVSSATAMDQKVYDLQPSYGYNRITVWPILPSESLPELETVDQGPEEESICMPEP